MGRSCRLRGRRLSTSKGLPAAHSPHKKRTPTGLCGPMVPRPELKPRAQILPSSGAAAVVVSIVVPVRNEAENVAPLIDEIAAALDGRWAYEIVYVDDGSTD